MKNILEILVDDGLNGDCIEIKGKKLKLNSVKYILSEFCEDYYEEKRVLSRRDLEEVKYLAENPSKLQESYLFKKIEPYVLEFYLRPKEYTSTLDWEDFDL